MLILFISLLLFFKHTKLMTLTNKLLGYFFRFRWKMIFFIRTFSFFCFVAFSHGGIPYVLQRNKMVVSVSLVVFSHLSFRISRGFEGRFSSFMFLLFCCAFCTFLSHEVLKKGFLFSSPSCFHCSCCFYICYYYVFAELSHTFCSLLLIRSHAFF